MLALISFILVCIGCINWFCIGILQFDFVAGIFGSQSNIFSRLIYTLVGIASIVMVVNFVTNKGKFVVSFNKANKEFEDMKEERREEKRRKALAAESAEDFSLARALKKENENKNSYNAESAKENDFHHKKDFDCECGKDCDCHKNADNKKNK